MNSNTPNLFHHATKELAQDAALDYILTWARPAYRESHPCLHRLGTALLRALLATWVGKTTVPTITSLEVETQFQRIDLLALINDENEVAYARMSVATLPWTSVSRKSRPA